jgi:hypothetical protein
MQEDLAGIKVTQAYAQEKEKAKKFMKSQDDCLRVAISQNDQRKSMLCD